MKKTNLILKPTKTENKNKNMDFKLSCSPSFATLIQLFFSVQMQTVDANVQWITKKTSILWVYPNEQTIVSRLHLEFQQRERERESWEKATLTFKLFSFSFSWLESLLSSSISCSGICLALISVFNMMMSLHPDNQIYCCLTFVRLWRKKIGLINIKEVCVFFLVNFTL